VGPRAGLDTEAKGKILSPLPGIEPRSPGRPSSNQTLYCLRYSAHNRQSTILNLISIVKFDECDCEMHFITGGRSRWPVQVTAQPKA
jgi:hypothetical protein